MSIRFTSQLQIDNLPDEQLNDQFEVIMPSINLSEAFTNKSLSSNANPTSTSSLSKFIDKIGLSNISIYNYRPIVEEITFGPRMFKTTTRRVRTGWYNVPEDIDNYHEVNITMFCSSGMLTQLYLEAWKREIYNEKDECYNGGNTYKKNIQVYLFGPMGNTGNLITGGTTPSFTFTLVGCFPKSQEEYKLTYSNEPNRFRIMATFCVDNVIYDTKQAKKAVITELATSPTSIIDNILSQTLNESAEYSTHTAYTSDGKNYTSE